MSEMTHLATSQSVEKINTEFDLSILEVVNSKVNLTKICQHFDKRIDHWLKSKSTQRFLEAYKAITPNGVIEIIKGGNGEQGTFGDRKIALKLAEWISVNFEIWANQQLDTLLQTGKVELQPAKELTKLELLEMALESEKAKIELEKRVTTQQLLISKQNDHNSKLLVMKATQTKTGLKTVKNDIGIEINHLVFKLFPSDTYHNSHKKAHLTYKQDTGLVYVGANKASLESKIDYLNYLRSKDGNNMIISC